MKKRKEKEFKIRTYLTGIIWLALACSMIISALLFAFLKHFLEMPENIPAIVWLLIFNTMIAGLITALFESHIHFFLSFSSHSFRFCDLIIIVHWGIIRNPISVVDN